VSAAGFFQAWPPVPYTADVTALGAAAGVDGGLLALSALERSPLARVLLQGLPALGGFQAAYLGEARESTAHKTALVYAAQHIATPSAPSMQLPTNALKTRLRLASAPQEPPSRA
jgi:hypothetical protein